VRFRIEITDRGWREYVHPDTGPPVPGWSGTYTRDGRTVHATDESLRCDITYAVALDDDALRVQVLRDEGGRRDCGHGDLVAARALDEAAPFTRSSPGG
jgi:hypothetical protein